MVEQKLPKLLKSAEISHPQRKTSHKLDVSFQSLGFREQSDSAPEIARLSEVEA